MGDRRAGRLPLAGTTEPAGNDALFFFDQADDCPTKTEPGGDRCQYFLLDRFDVGGIVQRGREVVEDAQVVLGAGRVVAMRPSLRELGVKAHVTFLGSNVSVYYGTRPE
jgi:hypothetical protein